MDIDWAAFGQMMVIMTIIIGIYIYRSWRREQDGRDD